MEQGQKVLLSSGGMDSFLLAGEPELQGAIHVFVDINQKYLHKEREAAKYVAQKHNAQLEIVVATNMAIYEHETGIIPFRNAEMLLCAAQYGTELYLGVIADEINSDKSVEFCHAVESVLNISHKAQYWTDGRRFTVHTPFREVSKSQLVQRFFDRGGQLEDLLRSVSCYSSTKHHCGKCASCFKRWVALVNTLGYNGWNEWGFESDPSKWKTVNEWRVAMADYSNDRRMEILSALNTD